VQVPGQSLGNTVDVDTFCWIAEALLSANPDVVLRPVKMPKHTRVGRFKAIAKVIGPVQVRVYVKQWAQRPSHGVFEDALFSLLSCMAQSLLKPKAYLRKGNAQTSNALLQAGSAPHHDHVRIDDGSSKSSRLPALVRALGSECSRGLWQLSCMMQH
jgi:hypothetical protein